MCIRSLLNEEIINQFEENIDREEQTNWPTSIQESENLLACSDCFYPIAKLFNTTEISVRKINEHITVSAIIETKFLLTENFQRIAEITNSWQNQIFCFGCNKLISYTEENVPEHITTYLFKMNSSNREFLSNNASRFTRAETKKFNYEIKH